MSFERPSIPADHADETRRPSPWRTRWRRALALACVTYVAAAALAASGPPNLAGFLALVFGLACAWRAGGAPRREAWALFACALAVGSATGGAGAPLLVRALGDGALAVSLSLTTLALVRLAATPSLASQLARPWPIVAVVPPLLVATGIGGSPFVVGVALGVAASFVALSALAEMHRRRFELGLRARPLAVFACMTIGLGAAAVSARLFPSGFSDAVVRATLAPASLAATMIALRGNELRIARATRLLTVLVIFGGGVVLLALDLTLRAPLDAGPVVVVGGALALAIGATALRLADGLRPERGAWLDAIAAAEEALLRDGSEDAIREALVRLRAPAGADAASPELWSFDPVRVLRIDAAGYAHEGEGLYPADVVRVASEEPEATLRVDVLRELEVRRPDLRPALRWLADRGALGAVVVTEAGEARGLLVLPEGRRVEPMTLEEVIALKRLADRFAGVAGFRAAIARGLERERTLAARIESLEDRLGALEHAAAREAARHERATLRLARPATVGLYAASSRLSYDALEARTRVGAPLVVVHPSGVDPVPYVARAHLSGARAKGALVLVDGTAAREHEKERWTDPVASPLALADRGVLLLVDGAVLPGDVQRLVAQALAEKRAPWERAEPLDVVLALTLTNGTEPDALVESGRLDPALAARLGDALTSPIRLPGLAERAEDLRALLTDRLAREGLRVRGEPVALSDGALGRLVEHAFPGDETELAAIVQALVARARGSLVQAEDVDALGLARANAEEGDESSLPRIRLV